MALRTFLHLAVSALLYCAVTAPELPVASARQTATAPAATAPPQSGAGVTPAEDYVLGSEDVLTITVWNQRDLSGDYRIESDGTLMFPLIGRVKAGGLTLRGVEGELERHLKDGFFNDPQVSVSVQTYQSQRIYLVGEVKQPGTYPLTQSTTLIEVLSRAGATLSNMTGEVLIVRPRGSARTVNGPVLPDQGQTTEVIRVDIAGLQTGGLFHNVALRDGDTIVVSQGEKVFVTGEVRTPGAYTVPKGTTLLQLVSIAGGLTDRGAMGRVKAVREIKGQKKEVGLKPEDVVQAGDTITVPQRFF